MSEFGNPRTDVRTALSAAGWREDSRGRLVAANGMVWSEVNDLRDSGLDGPGGSWSIHFDSNVPATVIVAACLAAAGQAVTR
ncbi:hypothetical protein [Streptomyces reticuli]|uniref:hypothetical protein n=1 Tax=Streptomyces reticuli TaxID=1926 RepID=UPI00073DBF13|nr:hypothetical protein [Streptomyces sp. SID7810]CUW31714.1 hypothetical protein TUE45_06463 [Streptomyces reticuli]